VRHFCSPVPDSAPGGPRLRVRDVTRTWQYVVQVASDCSRDITQIHDGGRQRKPACGSAEGAAPAADPSGGHWRPPCLQQDGKRQTASPQCPHPSEQSLINFSQQSSEIPRVHFSAINDYVRFGTIACITLISTEHFVIEWHTRSAHLPLRFSNHSLLTYGTSAFLHTSITGKRRR
jgi:hypothetical protein